MTSTIDPTSGTPTASDCRDGETACGGCGISRRTFLGRSAAVGAVGVVATVGLTGCTGDLQAEASAPSRHPGGSPAPALPAGDLPVGSQASVSIEGRTLLLHRESEDTVRAFSAKCTHQGCTVAPDQDRGRPTFACPCHGSHFDVTTGVPYGGPAQKPLTEFTATVDDDMVMVRI
ncbi:ubiquinol-cytochrome c reductase iron-sulfur subunit [Citricoccus nitrophenolicus]|uniref:QcrA and Rieske domain-containing protein n=1 Tax=Citricoccus nitrophenolicus TaxID=863575 RepID=UPI0039B64192